MLCLHSVVPIKGFFQLYSTSVDRHLYCSCIDAEIIFKPDWKLIVNPQEFSAAYRKASLHLIPMQVEQDCFQENVNMYMYASADEPVMNFANV